MADYNYRKNFRMALIIDEAFLLRMKSLMDEFLPNNPIVIVLETDGQISVEAKDISEILSGELIQTHTIKKLQWRREIIRVRKFNPFLLK